MSVSATIDSPPMDFRLNELQPMLFAKSVNDALSRFQLRERGVPGLCTTRTPRRQTVSQRSRASN